MVTLLNSIFLRFSVHNLLGSHRVLNCAAVYVRSWINIRGSLLELNIRMKKQSLFSLFSKSLWLSNSFVLLLINIISHLGLGRREKEFKYLRQTSQSMFQEKPGYSETEEFCTECATKEFVKVITFIIQWFP